MTIEYNIVNNELWMLFIQSNPVLVSYVPMSFYTRDNIICQNNKMINLFENIFEWLKHEHDKFDWINECDKLMNHIPARKIERIVTKQIIDLCKHK